MSKHLYPLLSLLILLGLGLSSPTFAGKRKTVGEAPLKALLTKSPLQNGVHLLVLTTIEELTKTHGELAGESYLPNFPSTQGSHALVPRSPLRKVMLFPDRKLITDALKENFEAVLLLISLCDLPTPPTLIESPGACYPEARPYMLYIPEAIDLSAMKSLIVLSPDQGYDRLKTLFPKATQYCFEPTAGPSNLIDLIDEIISNKPGWVFYPSNGLPMAAFGQRMDECRMSRVLKSAQHTKLLDILGPNDRFQDDSLKIRINLDLFVQERFAQLALSLQHADPTNEVTVNRDAIRRLGYFELGAYLMRTQFLLDERAKWLTTKDPGLVRDIEKLQQWIQALQRLEVGWAYANIHNSNGWFQNIQLLLKNPSLKTNCFTHLITPQPLLPPADQSLLEAAASTPIPLSETFRLWLQEMQIKGEAASIHEVVTIASELSDTYHRLDETPNSDSQALVAAYEALSHLFVYNLPYLELCALLEEALRPLHEANNRALTPAVEVADSTPAPPEPQAIAKKEKRKRKLERQKAKKAETRNVGALALMPAELPLEAADSEKSTNKADTPNQALPLNLTNQTPLEPDTVDEAPKPQRKKKQKKKLRHVIDSIQNTTLLLVATQPSQETQEQPPTPTPLIVEQLRAMNDEAFEALCKRMLNWTKNPSDRPTYIEALEHLTDDASDLPLTITQANSTAQTAGTTLTAGPAIAAWGGGTSDI